MPGLMKLQSDPVWKRMKKHCNCLLWGTENFADAEEPPKTNNWYVVLTKFVVWCRTTFYKNMTLQSPLKLSIRKDVIHLAYGYTFLHLFSARIDFFKRIKSTLQTSFLDLGVTDLFYRYTFLHLCNACLDSFKRITSKLQTSFPDLEVLREL